MNIALVELLAGTWSKQPLSTLQHDERAELVLCFASKAILESAASFEAAKQKFPNATIAMCSTAGEIYQETVQDDSLVAIAIEFSHTTIKAASVNSNDFPNSYAAAEALSTMLLADDLAYVMVLSDGSLVNGSELVKGFSAGISNTLVTGGLAGDAADFKSTLVGLNQKPTEGTIVAIGFYGKKLVVTHGSQGGWDMFGLEKEITRSEHNVLYEIEHANALELYKKYLGPDIANLPSAALLFPLSVTIPGANTPIVRTILSIDEEKKSMTFAGDVPVGSKVRFMKANFDKLTSAAATAAQQTMLLDGQKPDFVFLVSCVGRKLILGPRIEEEVEAVSDTLGNDVPMIGFYAYGEISPFSEGGGCQLHNQTMTITSFYELP